MLGTAPIAHAFSSIFAMTDWLATILIVLPLVAALIVWLLPLADRTVGSLALLAALVEIGVWINAVTRFDFGVSWEAPPLPTGGKALGEEVQLQLSLQLDPAE